MAYRKGLLAKSKKGAAIIAKDYARAIKNNTPFGIYLDFKRRTNHSTGSFYFSLGCGASLFPFINFSYIPFTPKRYAFLAEMHYFRSY